MPNIDIVKNAQLRIGAHVLTQLGRELVTDPEQALLELVKNAYDADSSHCEISIDSYETGVLEHEGRVAELQGFVENTESVAVELEAAPNTSQQFTNSDRKILRRLTYTGKIAVRDSGIGLTPDSVINSWLVVSKSIKRVDHGRPKYQTARGRTPLGDKGLGRLGTMRLGDILYIRSAQKGSTNVTIAWFRWADCEGAETLDRIPVEVETHENNEGFEGTEVIVYGLNDLADWRDPGRARQLSYSIASVVSPFEAVGTFPVHIRVDGAAYDLEQVSNDLLKRAVSDFTFRYDVDGDGNGMLHCVARFRRNVFTASSKSQTVERARFVLEQDGGAAFLRWLKKGRENNGEVGSRRLRKYDRATLSQDGEWLIELHDQVPFSDIYRKATSKIADPGPFEGALYYFNFNRVDGSATGDAATRERFRRIKGVAILRDGFRVRESEDWLDLSRSMTSGSTYHLRVDNTAGYFALTGANNFRLTEKSDREGFVDDPYYRGFRAIAERCRNFANRAQEDVRRALDDYARQFERETSGAQHMSTAAAVRVIKASGNRIGKTLSRVSKLSEEHKENLKKLSDSASSEEKAKQAIELAESSSESLRAAAKDLEELRNIDAAGTILSQGIEVQAEQVNALIESAAVGLAARGLTHEISTHLAEIERNTHSIRQSVRKTELSDRLLPRLRAIDLARRALIGAASQIDPMLPRTRAVKENIELPSFCRTYFDNRSLELDREGIEAQVVEETSLTILMNRTRLLQVIDNLVANSRYWLQRQNAPAAGGRSIEIRVDKRGFIFSDNGPGVARKTEDSLFDIFVTEKPAGRDGQGLGLYIVTQLLGIDGCTIELLETRNERGNRFAFRVDLTKVAIKKAE